MLLMQHMQKQNDQRQFFWCIPEQHVPPEHASSIALILLCSLWFFGHIFFPFLQQFCLPEGPNGWESWFTKHIATNDAEEQTFSFSILTISSFSTSYFLLMSLIAWSISSEYQCKGTCINSAFACAKGLKTKPDHFSEKSLSNALTTPIVYSLASDHIAS